MYETEPRGHDWLIRYAAQEVRQDLPRVRRYLAGILAADRPLTLDALRTGAGDRAQAYRLSRGGAALIGRKAFLWRTPGTPHYHSDSVATEILDGLRVFREHQTADGDFALGDAWAAYLPHHEHAWRLEPLVWARLWLEPWLKARDKAWIDALVRRAGKRLLWFADHSPNDTLQYCNRGVVWLAVTTLVGLYLDRDEYRREVERHADRILCNTMTARGEILEGYLHYSGGGPDSGYSATTWVYAAMYRLLSGRAHLDERLVAAQKWFIAWLTHSGWPLASAASVRHAPPQALACDLLPGLELLAEREPFFDTLADRLLDAGREHEQGHCLHPFIWAMLSHRPRPAVPAPDWYRHHEGHFEHQAVQYSLIQHQYQVGVTWRGIHPGRGLQTFAHGEEAPIIHPAGGIVSTILAGDIDTAQTNVAAGPCGWELLRRTGGPGDGYEPASPATVVLTRKGTLWECLVFTPAAVIHVAGGVQAMRARWVLHATPESPARCEARARLVTFAGRAGRMVWLSGTGRLASGTTVPVLEVTVARCPAAFGLGGPDLRLERFDARRQMLHFSDASGRYALFLGAILDPVGNLNLAPELWTRLTRCTAPASRAQ